MTIARFTPITDVVSLRDAMDRLFEDSYIRPSGMPAGQVTVPVDLGETKDAFLLRADLPGVSPDDIQISATADTITIAGEIKDDTDKNVETWLRQERCAGRFQRSFALPVQIDPNKVEAHFNNGVLELVLPKSELVKPRTIRVNATNTTNPTTAP